MAAESIVQCDQINTKVENGLKHLNSVHVAAIQTLESITMMYDLAKEKSRPLKVGVQIVEGTVKVVVGHIYNKFHGVPFEILKFADHKVGDIVEGVDHHLPSLVKKTSSQAYAAAQKVPEVARSISDSVHHSGIINTVAGIANAAYVKVKPVAEQYAASTWQSLNNLPVFPRVAGVVVPNAAHWAEKYNGAVCYYAEKGYSLSAYLPMVPTEKIANVFGESRDEVVKTPA